jgi:type VI secretion system protein ImpC
MADQKLPEENKLPTDFAEPLVPSEIISPGPDTSALGRIVVDTRIARDPSQIAYGKDLIGEFVTQVLDEGMTVSNDAVASIKTRIAQIDELLSVQMNEILHDEAFQSLESSWRGLNYLVMNSETGTHLKLRLLNATKKELTTDLEKAVEFDQSALFKKIYEEEYGTFGGYPYTFLVGDYEFGRHPQDMATLEKLSNVAAAAHAPFVSAASPKLFDMDSFTELGIPRDLAKGFETAELIKWRSFRESEDSRYVALVLPHVLSRLPYGPDTVPVDGFNYVEDTDGKDHRKYLWSNGAYTLAQRITNAFSLFRWTAAIRGVEGGGIVEGLPAHTFHTDEGDIALKCPTEIAITDRREKELNDLGFISLCHCKNTDYAAFFGGQTTNKPKVYNTNQANANSKISSMLPYILASSRFAHYIKVIMRDKIGSFMTRDNVANYLNTWISDYVLLNDDAPQSLKAQYPLREARVDVVDVPGKPGAYKAIVFLRPHFQLDELTVSIRLVAELPAPAAAA